MDSFIVYKHTNKINGKIYIGITSQRVEDRWKGGSGYATQVFGRAIRKYGWHNFTHEVIAENLSQEDAFELERILIKSYRTSEPKYGYNVSLGGAGGGMYNKHHTDAAREKIRIARKRDGFSDEHKKHISESKKGVNHHMAKKVFQYTQNGEFIREWDYMSLASRELNISKANIGEVCNGNRKTAGGYIWKYERGGSH